MSKILKKSKFLKAVSTFLVLTFSFYNISFAAVEKDISAPAVPEAADLESKLLSAEDIGIAIDTGTIKNRYAGDAGKIIIHIQDAHCNYEAQTNINKILDQITKENGIDMISVEGAEGIVDTAWFRAFPDAEIRKEVATYFMKKGEITGAEFFSINSDYNGTIFGAETRDYYVKNLRAFTEVYPYKERIEKYLKDAHTITTRLKSIVYSPELKAVDSKIKSFNDKETELSAYAEYLQKTASKNKVDIKDCNDFNKLLQTLEYEKKIDFDIVDQERSDYIDVLSKKMPKEAMTELVAQSIRFKKGHIKAVNFYSFLRSLAKEYDIAMVQEYPNLFYYYIYTKLYDGINNENLFKEIDRIEMRLKKKLFRNETQEQLDKYSSMLDMYVALINIELTNEDYDRFKLYSDEFSMDDVLDFMIRLCNKYNLNYSIERLPAEIKELLPKMVDFYEIAMRRDNALIDNTLKKMQEEGKDRCVLIAGGFHTRGIRNILEKKGISYVVVTPKITKDVETPYIKVLTNQRTSLEDIITDSAVMPGVGVNAAAHEGEAFSKEKLLSPLLAAASVTMLFDEEGQKKLKELSEKCGKVGDRDFEQRVKDTFSGFINEATGRWLDKIHNQLNEQYNAQEADKMWDNLIHDKAVSEMLIGVYLNKVRDGLKLGYDKDKNLANEIYKTLETKIKFSLTMLIEVKFGGDEAHPGKKERTPGETPAGTTVVSYRDARHVDRVYEKMIHTAKVFKWDSIREGFQFVAYPKLIETLLANGLPTDIRPGRGGDALLRKGLQVHLDIDVYNALKKEGLLFVVAKHDLAHLDIFNAEEIAGSMPGRDAEDIENAIQTRLGKDALTTWKRWVKEGKPEGEKQEYFVNKTLKHDVTGRVAEIVAGIVDKKLDIKQRKIESLAMKRANLRELRQDVIPGKDKIKIIAVTNKGDGGIIKESLQKVANIFRSNKNNVEIHAHEEYPVRGQFLGGLDALKDVYREPGDIALGVMLPGKGKRLSPFTQSLHGIKPLSPILIRARADGQWLSAAEASLYTWNLVAYHLKRMGFAGGIAWKWGDEPQLPSIALSNLNMNLKNAHIVRFGSKVIVTEDLARNKEWLSADEDGTLIAQVRRRPRAELLQRLCIVDKPDATAMVHIGSPAFSDLFLQEAKKIFGRWEGWIDVDGYLIEAMTQDADTWDAENRREIRNAVKEVVGKYYKKDEKINIFTVASKLFGEKKFHSATDNASIVLALKELAERDGGVTGIEEGVWIATGGTWTPEQGDRETIKFKEPGMHELLKQHKDFYKACQKLKFNIEKKSGEKLTIKVVDFGEDLYWGDVGQLTKIRENYHLLVEDNFEGRFARELAVIGNITPDEFGNIVIGDCVYPKDGSVRNSFLANTKIFGTANINSAVLVDSNMRDAEIGEGSVVYGSNVVRLKMGRRAFSFRSIKGELEIKDDRVHTSMPKNLADVTEGFEDWWADTGLDEKGEPIDVGSDNYYKQPRFGNPRSFEEQTAKMRQRDIDPRNIENAIKEQFIEPLIKKMKITPSEFADVGIIREDDEALTEMEVFINTVGEMTLMLEREKSKGGIIEGDEVYIGEDLRSEFWPSAPSTGKAVAVAVAASGMVPIYCGRIPAPALVNYAVKKGMASVMVSGSPGPHRISGVKFYRADGYLMEVDEEPVRTRIKEARMAEYMKSKAKSMFDEEQKFKSAYDLGGEQKDWLEQAEEAMKGLSTNPEPENMYVTRNVSAFSGLVKDKMKDFLAEQKLAFWQQNAVGKDVLVRILRSIGINVEIVDKLIDPGVASDVDIIHVDTGKVTPKIRKILKHISSAFQEEIEYAGEKPFAILTTDSDSSCPLLADESGNVLSGDKLNLLAVKFLLSLDIKPAAVMCTATVSDSVKASLEREGITVVRTPVGPYNIKKAMDDWKAKEGHEKDIVLGWASDGGFILGSALQITGGGEIGANPVQDSAFPLIAAILLAAEKELSMSELIEKETKHPETGKHFYESADVLNFQGTFNLEKEEAIREMEEVAGIYSPKLKDKRVIAVDFDKKEILRLKGKDIKETFETEKGKIRELEKEDIEEWKRIKQMLEEIYKTHGLDKKIMAIDILDGIKITFVSGEISHLRPSKESPEFWSYGIAESFERAEEIAKKGTGYIIPLELRHKRVVEPKRVKAAAKVTPGVYTAAEGLQKLTEEPMPPLFKQTILELEKRIKEGRLIRFIPSFRRGKDGYTRGEPVGEPVEVSFILEMMGAETREEKIQLADKYGVPEEEVLSERWINDGLIDVGTGYYLHPRILALWANEVYGAKHIAQAGMKSGITAEVVTLKEPTEIQINEFPEMIIPLEDGYAYMGLSREVSEGEFIECLRKGDISIFNKIEVNKGVPIIVPRGMPYAYGEITGYKVKAVDIALDKVGALREVFYDRLRWAKLASKEKQEAEGILAKILKTRKTQPEKAQELVKSLIEKGYIRDKKDVLTLPEERAYEIARKIKEYGFLKKTDIEKFKSTPVVMGPIVVAKPEDTGRATCEKMGETEGFVSLRYTIEQGAGIEAGFPVAGREHALLVTEGEVEIIYDAEGVPTDILKQGEEGKITAGSWGLYTIKAIKGPAVVYTQYIPIPGEPVPSAKEFSALLEQGETTQVLTEEVPAHVSKAFFRQTDIMREKLEINDRVRLPEKIGERPVALSIQEESSPVVIEVSGKKLCDRAGEPVLFEAKESIFIERMPSGLLSLMDIKGRIFEFEGRLSDITLIKHKKDASSAVVEVQYTRTGEEKLVYTLPVMVRDNLPAIIEAGPIRFIQPEDKMYISGTKNKPGTRLWEQEQLRRYVSPNITIVGIKSVQGVEAALDMIDDKVYVLDKETGTYREARKDEEGVKVKNVLFFTQQMIDDFMKKMQRLEDGMISATEERRKAQEYRAKWNRSRINPIPDNIGEEGKGWFYTRESNGKGLLQAALTSLMIADDKGTGNVADYLERVMKQRMPNFERQHLYGMLSYTEITGIPEGVEFDTIRGIIDSGKLVDWIMFIKNILMNLPPTPFVSEAIEQLQKQREKLWQSV